MQIARRARRAARARSAKERWARSHDGCTGTDRPITLALTWTGEGDLAWGRSHSSNHSPGYHVTYRLRGQEREATAVGSLTLDGTPLSLGTGIGYLSKVTNGTITRSN
jgi:hypothetical protein